MSDNYALPIAAPGLKLEATQKPETREELERAALATCRLFDALARLLDAKYYPGQNTGLADANMLRCPKFFLFELTSRLVRSQILNMSRIIDNNK